MYLGIDVGGTKTLVTVLDVTGKIIERVKFPTPSEYDEFLKELATTLHSLKTQEFAAGAIAIPGHIDREHGRGINFGNLAWHNIPVQHDLEVLLSCPVKVENDAKLAALSEAMLLRDEFKKVLYVTVSTGIGYGLINDGVIDTSLGDIAGRAILLEHRGKMVPWETFASGKAIVERYGKRAEEITDKETWRHICRDLAKGFVELIAITEPEVIVIGGSVGTYFNRYGEILESEIKKYHVPLVTNPALRAAQRPEEAVVYGCYELIKQVFPHAAAHR